MSVALFLPIAVILTAFTSSAWAQDFRFDEFSIKRDYYSTRFDGYYEHYINIEKFDEMRKQGANEEKARRKKYQSDYESYRKEFLAEKKRQPPVDNQKWEQELIERKKQLEVARKEYAKKNKELKSYIQKHNYIPAEEEFDIDINYFED